MITTADGQTKKDIMQLVVSLATLALPQMETVLRDGAAAADPEMALVMQLLEPLTPLDLRKLVVNQAGFTAALALMARRFPDVDLEELIQLQGLSLL